MSIAACLATGKDTWQTPDALFQVYNSTYDFVLDAAADPTNHKVNCWFGPGGEENDALAADWSAWLEAGNIWLNPPYSRGLQAAFIKKAVAEVHRQPVAGAHKVVCLVPSRTDTKLFHDVIRPNATIEFLRGRVKFVDAKNGAPFPSMIVVFGKEAA